LKPFYDDDDSEWDGKRQDRKQRQRNGAHPSFQTAHSTRRGGTLK